MRATRIPVNRKYGTTAMVVAPRRRQRSSASGTDGGASEMNAGSTSPSPRESWRSRPTLYKSALASGSLDPRPTSTTPSSPGSSAPTAAAAAFERRRAVVLHVAGTEEDERDGADRGGAAADERVDGGVEVGLGQLDEPTADLEAVRLAPQHVGELPVLVDAGDRAAAVADEEQR